MTKLITYSILVLFLLSACNSEVEPTLVKSVLNPESPLLNVVATDDDFPGDWKWVYVSFRQPGHPQGMDEKNISDSAYSNHRGYFYEKETRSNYYISMSHRLVGYQVPITNQTSVFSLPETVKGEDAFTPDLALVEREFETICSEGNVTINCEVVILYDDVLVSTITVTTPVEFGRNATKELLNVVVNELNRKILDLSELK